MLKYLPSLWKKSYSIICVRYGSVGKEREGRGKKSAKTNSKGTYFTTLNRIKMPDYLKSGWKRCKKILVFQTPVSTYYVASACKLNSWCIYLFLLQVYPYQDLLGDTLPPGVDVKKLEVHFIIILNSALFIFFYKYFPSYYKHYIFNAA
jgi:hypothetical protein